MLHGNIDILDASRGTKAPFTFGSTLRIGESTLDPSLFCAICAQVGPGVVPPLRIGYVDPLSVRTYRIWLVDDNGAQVASFALDADAPGSGDKLVARPMRDAYGILRGHVSYLQGLPGLVAAAVGTRTDRMRVARDAFELLPECLEAAAGGAVRAISVGGESFTEDVTIAGGNCVRLSADAERTRVGVIRTPGSASGGFEWLRANNVRHINGQEVAGMTGRIWIGGCHLVLKHGIASNLRVTREDAGIVLKGVLDG